MASQHEEAWTHQSVGHRRPGGRRNGRPAVGSIGAAHEEGIGRTGIVHGGRVLTVGFPQRSPSRHYSVRGS